MTPRLCLLQVNAEYWDANTQTEAEKIKPVAAVQVTWSKVRFATTALVHKDVSSLQRQDSLLSYLLCTQGWYSLKTTQAWSLYFSLVGGHFWKPPT